jgi:hypothetical protein
MLLKRPVKFRKPRRQVKPSDVSSATPAAPVLVAADVNTDDGLVATLTFDRAVSIAAFDGSKWTVVHQPLEGVYTPSGVSLTDAMTVRIDMTLDSACDPGPDVLLNAAAGNGVVAVDGGVAWAGASDLNLPFP